MTITGLQELITIPLVACWSLPTSRGLMDFNYYARIEEIAPRPILFIVGTNAATLFMSKPGYERAAQPKEWFEVPGATHHSLYDIDSDKAVPKLEEFFGRYL